MSIYLNIKTGKMSVHFLRYSANNVLLSFKIFFFLVKTLMHYVLKVKILKVKKLKYVFN